MPRIHWQLALAAAALQFSPGGLAFQLLPAAGPIAIIPRKNPRPPAAAADAPPTVLRVDSSLVLIPVHVTTALGSSVTNLSKDNFRLLEDGVPQRITQFAKDDAPVSIGLLFDASGSMKNKVKKISEAAVAFFKTTNPDDEFFLVEFNNRARLSVPFTRSAAEVLGEIARTRPSGRTSLLDAVNLGMAQMKKARNFRKALVILSDGGDNCSRRNVRQIKNALMECDAQVYAMGIFDSNYAIKHPPEEKQGPHLLGELTAPTGGRDFPVKTLDELPEISARIAREIHNQYLVGYSPANPARDGKYRKVRVKLSVPANMADLRTYYRQGYYALAQ